MTFIKEVKDGIEYYTVPQFTNAGFSNMFTTIRSGYSFSDKKELNFGANCNDTPENILKNYQSALNVIGASADKTVKSKQTHSDVTINVDASYGGEGILKEQRFFEADGLITSKKELALLIFYADCVPILLADKKTKTIAAVHSGWRGTRDNITGKAIQKLINQCNSNPENIMAAIGPSIGICHFEVEKDVYTELTELYGTDCGKEENEKYYLDLKKAVYNQLTANGVLEKNIAVSDLCTYCDESLYSFRRQGEAAGRMSAVILMEN